jgi:uncharacterized protein YndB with AHSA1/START domain
MKPTETVHAIGTIKAKPKAVYDAWIDAKKHAAMTGAAAESKAVVGGEFTAWDGYIQGTHLELQSPALIVQAWRTTDFDDKDADSKVIVVLEGEDGGTRVTIVHTDIPKGQGASYAQGWHDHYLTPMRRYFAKSKRKR